MNYRHAFHAGNFADVVKHAVLAILIERLKAKETPFRVIDTHAGVGLYDLGGIEAGKTGEWRDGIGRLESGTLDPDLLLLLEPYLSAVRAVNDGPGLTRYPGSPSIIRHLLRPQDRLTAVELHPEDAAALSRIFAGDRQVKVIALDGWLALGAFLPPKERRGLVLVDPPFEAVDEFEQLVTAFLKAHRRWPTGVYLLWYPVKDVAAIDRFRASLAASGIGNLLRLELTIRRRDAPGLFSGSGLILCNPPWQIERTLADLLARLAPILGDEAGAGFLVDPIAGEKHAAS
jgi:23S rRNA (adenine2030-N6)-methyltransferase